MLDVMPFDETSETELALHVSEEQAVGFNRLLHRTRRKRNQPSVVFVVDELCHASLSLKFVVKNG